MIIVYAITKLAKIVFLYLLFLKMKWLAFVFAKLKLQKLIIAYILVLLFIYKLSDLVFGKYFLGGSDFGEFGIFCIDLLKFVLVL